MVFAAFQEPQEMIIRGGVIVTVDGRNEADLRVRDGAIVEIGPNLTGAAGAHEIDATGLLVLPGGVDPHVHIGREDDYRYCQVEAVSGKLGR